LTKAEECTEDNHSEATSDSKSDPTEEAEELSTLLEFTYNSKPINQLIKSNGSTSITELELSDQPGKEPGPSHPTTTTNSDSNSMLL